MVIAQNRGMSRDFEPALRPMFASRVETVIGVERSLMIEIILHASDDSVPS